MLLRKMAEYGSLPEVTNCFLHLSNCFIAVPSADICLMNPYKHVWLRLEQGKLWKKENNKNKNNNTKKKKTNKQTKKKTEYRKIDPNRNEAVNTDSLAFSLWSRCPTKLPVLVWCSDR